VLLFSEISGSEFASLQNILFIINMNSHPCKITARKLQPAKTEGV
jgi:hypothetical protein